MFLGQQSPTRLIEVDSSTNPFGFDTLGTASTTYNALSYRPADDTLYAIEGGTNTLLQVNIDGSVSSVGEVMGLPEPPPTYVAGAFGPDGLMYVGGNNAFFSIDVDILTASSIPLSQSVALIDISWFEGQFYFVDNNDDVFKSVDTSGMVSVIGTESTGNTGAMFSASNGVFGVRNDGSGFFQFDVVTGDATRISDSPGSNNNDGARCLNEPLQFDADLSVTKDDGSLTYLPGTDVVYDIVVTNSGPFGVQNAEVSDPLPAGITTASWTCAGAAEGVCGADNGSGAIVDTPDLPVGASVTYTYTVTVPKDYSGDLVNTVTVELPDGFLDPTPGNNTATDVDESSAEPGIAIDKTGSGPDPLTVGATVDYTFVVTNTGNVTLSNVTVTDPLDGMSPISCPGDTLAPGEEMTCTATYTVTQQDADNGFIENTATATGDPPSGPSVSDEDSAVVPPSQKPGISLGKSGSGPNPLTVGATVEYTFVVTNTGNVTLTDVTVTDPLPGMSPISCPDTTLAPGATTTCTATYTVTQQDADNGSIENTATATGQPPGNLPPPTDESSATVPPSQTSGISIEKSGSGPDPLTVGATVEYSFVVTNTGNVTLTDVTVTDPLPGMSPISCPSATLAAGAEMTCTATYTVTQDDVNVGRIENTATVTGQPPQGPPVTDESSAVVPPSQAPGISIEKSGSGPDPLTVGATVSYTFVVTNTGNVTLSNVTVTDPLPGLSPISCPGDTLAPGAEMTCTASYTVTQADVDAGVIENTATVTGETPGGGTPPTDESTTTVPPEEPVPALPPVVMLLLVALLSVSALWALRRARA